jgi:Kelch motif
MRSRALLAVSLGLLLACSAEQNPTEPESIVSTPWGQPAAAASNTWSLRAPWPGGERYEAFAGTAPNPAGQSVVYVFGGTDGQGTGFGSSSYNVSTDTWMGGLASLDLFASNGVGKIGNRLYFSGGYVDVGSPNTFTNRLWAYDYANDRLIAKAPLPIFGAEGVTGVISGKLYVLPGACSGERYPVSPGYCAVEPTRRLFRYDPATNSWVSRRQAPHVHRNGAAAVIGGKLYVAGGFDGSDPVTALDVYDPGTNSWRTRAPIPRAGRAIGSAVMGKLHVLVGTSHYAYDPGTNRWRTLASSQYAHDALLKVQLNGRSHLLAVGGNHGPNIDIPNPTELYTP